MTAVLPMEMKLIERAQAYSKGKFSPENSKSEKLLKRVAAEPDAWLNCYKLFNSLSWATEMTLLGLNKEELETVAKQLKEMGIFGIQLSSAEGYKALGLAGVSKLQEEIHEHLWEIRHEIEVETRTLLRFDAHGIVVSGYKRGYPVTTYVSSNSHYHKVYLDNKGRFQIANRAHEVELPRGDELFHVIAAVEHYLPMIREAWGIWQQEQTILDRIAKLEKFGDAQGAFV